MSPGVDQPCPARRAGGIPSGVQTMVREPQLCDASPCRLEPAARGMLPPYQKKAVPTRRKGSPVDVIGVIIAGIIIGLLGKFFAPGDRDNIPLWLTVVCGIGGVLIGYYLAAALGVEATRGIDWTRWIISIIVAAVLVMIAASV